MNVIWSLCAGKSDSVNDICSDILKHASDRFIDYIVSLFNSILSHGCVHSSFLSSTTITIPKNPRLDLKTQRTTELLHLIVCLANIMFCISGDYNIYSQFQFTATTP